MNRLTEEQNKKLQRIRKLLESLLSDVKRTYPEATYYFTPNELNIMEHSRDLYHKPENKLGDIVILDMDVGDW